MYSFLVPLLLETVTKIQNQGMRNRETSKCNFLCLCQNSSKRGHTRAHFYLGSVSETFAVTKIIIFLSWYWVFHTCTLDLGNFFLKDIISNLSTVCWSFVQFSLLSNSENREHLKIFRNVDCVLANHNKVQDMQANLKTTN